MPQLRVPIDGDMSSQVEQGMQRWLPRILILPFIALFGIALGALPVRLLVLPYLGVPLDKTDSYARIVAWVLAALAVWLCVRHWRKADSKPAKPAPRQPGMPLVTRLLWVLGLTVGAFFVYGMIQGAREDTARKEQPGYAAFEAADGLLVGGSKGIANGNTPDAKQLAQQFSLRLKQARKLGIEGGQSRSIVSLTGGEFLTYCLLTRDTCVFMVHVPGLREFAKDAKAYMAAAAWEDALEVTAARKAGLRSIAVGLRGALMYDCVVAGRPDNPTTGAPASFGVINGNTECRELLQGHFGLSTPAPSAALPAPSGE